MLRPGNAHGSRGAVGVRRRLVRVLRARWPGIGIEVRADSGFAVPTVYAYCERAGIIYTIGLVPNPRLEAVAAPLLAEAQRQQTELAIPKVRLAGETTYQVDSWPHGRRVVYQAEALVSLPRFRGHCIAKLLPPRPGMPRSAPG